MLSLWAIISVSQSLIVTNLEASCLAGGRSETNVILPHIEVV